MLKPRCPKRSVRTLVVMNPLLGATLRHGGGGGSLPPNLRPPDQYSEVTRYSMSTMGGGAAFRRLRYSLFLLWLMCAGKAAFVRRTRFSKLNTFGGFLIDQTRPPQHKNPPGPQLPDDRGELFSLPREPRPPGANIPRWRYSAPKRRGARQPSADYSTRHFLNG